MAGNVSLLYKQLMKRLLSLLAAGALLSFPLLAQDSPPPSAPSSGQHDTSYAIQKNGSAQEITSLTPTEIQELRDAHEAALAADPFLAAEGQVLAEKMQAYRKKLNAAMIKADPKVAAILAKIPPRHLDGPGGPPPPPNGGN
jgi:Spy/CpxP family protein refolding chaperone